MYQDEYKRWAAADLQDFDLNKELRDIAGDDEAIKDRFAIALEFGTAGLRGVLGAGTNRMNIWVVRQATQGVADWVKTQGGTQTVAISYDSRLKGWNFAREAAGVLAANGIHVRLYEELMPVPALSFATRYYHCNAGIMITASHNPAQYNGYKAYGPDGCQMTDDAAAVVYASIQKTDVLTGAKHMSFAEGVEKGLIQFVGEDCKDAFYAAIEAARFARAWQNRLDSNLCILAQRYGTRTGYARTQGYRYQGYHYRAGAGISERLFHDLQLSESGNL